MAVQGKYKGVDIQSGNDAEVASQIATIDRQQANQTSQTNIGGQTSYTTGQAPITSQSLAPTEAMKVTPYEAKPPVTNFEDILTRFQEQTALAQQPAQDSFDRSLSDITSILTKQGTEATRKGELEVQAGLPEQQKQLNEIYAQVRGMQAQANQFIQNQEGRLAPSFAIVGAQAQAQRQLSAQTFGLAAAAETLQGNISLAQYNVQRALDAEFEPLKSQLEVAKLNYENNRDTLERIDKRRADLLPLLLGERERLLKNEEADKKEVYEIGRLAGQYGADMATVQRIFSAKSREEAATLAGSFLQDPKAKIELENAKLDTLLTKSRIKKEQFELSLLQKYGGMTPSQYSDYLKDEAKRIASEKDEAEKSLQQGSALQEKVFVIDAALKSKGFDSAVGTSFLTRTPKGAAGKLGATASIVGLPSVFGSAKDTLTGTKQQFIASVENLVSREFLDNLINVKAQGATFGALTEKEQMALTAAATKIGTWRVTDKNGNVLHYNANEVDFRAELERIKNLTKTAYQRATGKVWLPDEEEFWSQLEVEQQKANFNPIY